MRMSFAHDLQEDSTRLLHLPSQEEEPLNSKFGFSLFLPSMESTSELRGRGEDGSLVTAGLPRSCKSAEGTSFAFFSASNISIKECEVIFWKSVHSSSSQHLQARSFKWFSEGPLPPVLMLNSLRKQASGPWGPFEAEKDGLEVQRSTRVKSASNRAMRYHRRGRSWKLGS